MTYSTRARAYAERVIAGLETAGKLEIRACERFLRDLKRADEDKTWLYRYDAEQADRACAFIEQLPHIKGKWARQRLKISTEDWQCFIVCNLFGWLRRDSGLRRFTTAYLEVARKNAKSTLAAGIGLYMLAGDGEPGAEVYSAATTGDQARIVFDVARQMVLREGAFAASGIEAQIRGIYVPDDARKFEALNAEGSTLDGLNPHCTIVDELHAHKRREVYDVLDTARGARDQSLLLSITTAGSDRAGICYEQRTYVVKVLDGVFEDDTYFGIIYTIDDQHTAELQSLAALIELDKICTCNAVQTIQIDQLWREACAKHATTEIAARIPISDAQIIQKDRLEQETYAAPVTNDICSKKTHYVNREKSETRPNGHSEIKTVFQPQISDGESGVEIKQFSTMDALLNMASQEKSTTSDTRNRTGSAPFAKERIKTYALITAMSRELFGDFYANNAILQSVFSETLKKVYDAHSHTCNARKAKLKDGVLHVKRDADDWTDPAVWRKANPNYGVSVLQDDFERSAREAMNKPSALNNFLTKRLNVWVNADSAWMDMRAWDACADMSIKEEDFIGEECIAALDLASKVDIAAEAKLFQRDGKYYAFLRYYLPEAAAEDGRNSQYSGWARQGLLTLTPGNVTDFDQIEVDLLEDCSRYQMKEVPFDPFQATQLSSHMLAEGVPMVEMRPTVLNFSEPMKQLEALVLQKKFVHNGDPILAWMVSNVVCHRDQKDNIYPRKEREENKIDGVVALIMALGRAMAGNNEGPSVYEERGVLTL